MVFINAYTSGASTGTSLLGCAATKTYIKQAVILTIQNYNECK
jgi:hypothetical protein